MEDVFTLRGATCQLQLQQDGLRWTTDKGSQLIQTAKILGCWQCAVGDNKCWDTFVKMAADRPTQDLQTSNTVLSRESLVSACTLDTNHSEVLSTSDTKHIQIFSNLDDNQTEIKAASSSNPKCNTLEERNDCESLYENISKTSSSPQSCISKSYNYKTFTSERSFHVSEEEGECCHTSGERHASLYVQYCERVLPSKCSLSCFPHDPDAVVGLWRTKTLVFRHLINDVTRKWYTAIRNAINMLTERPQHLAIIMNPISGNKDAMKVYRAKVVPLLTKAAISTTVFTTTASEPGEQQGRAAVGVAGVDGVVVMGGDGLVARVLKGVMQDMADKEGKDINDPNTPLPKCPIRFGIIPCGSTNCTLKSVQGTDDVTSSVLHIIMGDRCKLDAAGAYDSSGLVHVFSNTTGMGLLGRANQRLGTMRWMRKELRVPLAGAVELMRHKHYAASIKALVPANPTATPHDANICSSGCAVCSAGRDPAEGATWLKVDGMYQSVLCFMVSTRGAAMSKYGMSPAAHIADGCCDVILIPRMNFFKLMYKLNIAATTRNHLDSETFPVVRCCELEVNTPEGVPWAMDGETHTTSRLRIKVHRKTIEFFGRGLELLSSLKM